jgi:hypothetical protein
MRPNFRLKLQSCTNFAGSHPLLCGAAKFLPVDALVSSIQIFEDVHPIFLILSFLTYDLLRKLGPTLQSLLKVS